MRLTGAVLLMMVVSASGFAFAQENRTEESPVMKVNPDAPSPTEMKAADADPLAAAAAATSTETSGKKFTGSPITLKMRDADIHEVMRLISEASGFNIVLNPAVKGNVTVSLENVPWDQALEVVMTTLGLAADRNDSVLRVMPRDMLLRQKQEEIENAKLSQISAPRITRVFPLSYSDPSSIQKLLKDYLAPMGATAGFAPPSILVDDNTQSLVIQDTATGIDKAKKIIRLLDVQTPQLLIETKVVDATESFSHTLDGKFQLDGGGFSAAINGGLAGAGAGSSGAATTGDKGSLNTFKFGIGSTLTLNALLNYSEGESKAKVISTPRVLALSGKKAKILQGSNLAVKQVTTSNGVTTETTTFVPYSTSLAITSRATNDGCVLMNLELSRDTVVTDQSGQTSVAPRNITTEVIVESGNTLVIGGVQSSSESAGSGGFPFLRKIPIIGWLFGKESAFNDHNELMFFVTPRILNVRKTAIGDGSDSEEKPAKL